MQYNRDPPPYPGHSKQLCQPAGFRQSYSGSETSGTDLSMSSNENLALTTRQDPQGEEQLQGHHADYQYSIQLDDNSILARLGLPAVEVKSTTNGSFYVTGSMPVTKDSQPFYYDYPEKPKQQVYPEKQQQQLLYYTSAQGSMQLINNNNDVDFSCLPPPPEYPGTNHGNGSQTSSHHSNHQTTSGDRQSQHGSIHSSSSELSAEGQSKRPLCRSYEVINAQGSVSGQAPNTRSQPDLSRFKELKLVNIMDVHPAQVQQQVEQQRQHEQQRLLQQQQQLYGMAQQPRRSSPGTPPHEMPRPLTEKERSNGLPPIQPKPKRDSTSSAGGVGVDAAMASRALQMVDLLSEENKALRDELNSYHKKISKLQQFEKEIQKVHEAHESLIRSAEKRESLERTMRMKLQAEVTKLRESNKEFSERLEKTLAELTQRQSCGAGDGGTDVRLEISKKDAIIAKLVAQNRELSVRNDQLDGDMQLQQSTIQEQRAHIDVLDNALNNAQANVIRMEEELFRRQYQSERIDQLQKALTQIQVTADNRESIHQQLKRKYQLDVNALRAKFEGSPVSSNSDINSEKHSNDQQLEAGIRERDTKILELEAERSQWEQRYLQESALRELAIDAASQPKEARIAALEQNSADTERLMQEARSEKLKHLEEVYMANKKSGDLEVRVKTLQAQLAEKDALVRVFQKHSFSASSLGSVFSTPSHSPHPSTLMPIHSISTSHSHNHLTNTDTVAASAYMGYHAQTGSTSDCPPYIKSNNTDSSNLLVSPHSSTTTIAALSCGALSCGSGTTASALASSSAHSLCSAPSVSRSQALSTSAGSLNTGGGGGVPSSVTVAAASQADTNKKPSQCTKQSLLQFLAHKRLHQSDNSSRSRSSSQSSTSSASGLWQV